MVRPQRTADPAECLALAKRDGAAILTGVGTGSKAAVTAMALDVIGEHALGIQSPVHVGTNNFGFRGGQQITNLDRRPAHVDSVLDYGDKGHPDFFFLCCRTASAEGGGASYLIDLEECLTQIEPWARVALEGLKIVQKIELPPNYGSYSLPAGSDSNAQTMDAADANTAQAEPEAASEAAWEPGSRAGKRVEQLFTRTAAGRKLLRVSSFSDAAALLEDMEAEIINLRPVPSSTSPDRDMAVVRQWLHAVATAEENAPRVVLKEGEAILVDNYRCAHGRDGYSDLSRAMWQIWVWSDRCVVDSMPQDPGVGREWLPLHSKSMGTQPGPSPHMAPKL